MPDDLDLFVYSVVTAVAPSSAALLVLLPLDTAQTRMIPAADLIIEALGFCA